MTTEIDFTGIETKAAWSLSPQQLTIMDWVENGTGNALIVAVAGAGKTTTLIEACARMYGRVAFCAYNRRIADEIKEKVSKRTGQGWIKVNTFHAFGYAAWRKAYPQTKLDENKVRDIIKEISHTDSKGVRTVVPRAMYEFVEKLVSMTRQAGVGILCPINKNDVWNEIIAHHGLDDILTGRKPWDDEVDMDPQELQALIEEGKKWALRTLRQSIAMGPEKIDFEDMLYLPLYEGLAVEQFDWVLIDEAQDSNPTRRAFAKVMLRPGGRLVAVGDPAQAIYGFTGADSESLQNIKDEFGCIELPLTVSYRCPRKVVEMARQWVSHIEPADNAPEGTVALIGVDYLLDVLPQMEMRDLEASVVLCRKNAPLVDMAFGLIRQRVACHVEGREIGAQVKALVDKFRVNHLKDLMERVNEYSAKEVAKFLAKGQEARAETVQDRCDTLKALAFGLMEEGRQNVSDLLALCDTLFADGSKVGLTLSSIHKSKGREWPTVYWLGRNAYQPSPFARQAWQMGQEVNLMYVAATRAQESLVEVMVETRREVA